MSRLSWIIRRPRHFSAAVALSTLLGLAAHPMTASATDTPTDAAKTAAPEAPARAPASAAATTHVEGFRSAHFGMNQAEVRKAIIDDFNIKSAAIKSTTDEIQKTAILQVTAPDVLQGGGIAQVSYIFGYKSKKLIQVHVVWSRDIDPKLTPDRMLTNGKLLQSYFAGAGYHIMGPNIISGEDMIMFRGNDADNHITALVLHGTIIPGKNKQQASFVTTGPLTLDYFENLQKPDIYQLPAGKF
ncbi:MAG TPA: hypothetical protein VL574_15310 [Stellaceae bacterium]|jgi:hypothetical protein|nr:hypothetical protein [Stellaceae bacterium]